MGAREEEIKKFMDVIVSLVMKAVPKSKEKKGGRERVGVGEGP